MAANLSPEFLAAERDYQAARTQAERIAALARMLSTVPKHKGTEKLQADIKRRLAQARRESAKGGAHAVPFYFVEKEGAGQLVLLGPPNSGKSQLLCSLTHARPEVAPYPFTTRMPTPGMMRFEDVQIQLIDLPPVSPEFTEAWLPQVIRNADAGVLVVDVNDPAILDEVEFVPDILSAARLPVPKVLVANKADLPGACGNFDALCDLYGSRYRCLAVSALNGINLDQLGREFFELLGLVRIYTKPPGKKVDLTSPFVLHRGETVQDAARMVHKDFAEHLKYARLFRGPGEREGLMVERTHVLEDADILEFHL